VHSAAGGHSLGTYPQIIESAKVAGFHYVFVTEHPKERPLYARVVDPQLVVIYGVEEERDDTGRTLRDEASKVRILAYLEGLRVPDDVNGLEIFNMFESAKESQSTYAWINWLYHQFTYEDLFFFHMLKLDEKRLRAWDRTSTRRHLTGVGGNDAHQNLGLTVQTTAGDRLFGIEVDPYLLSFRFLTNHLFIPYTEQLTPEAVLRALQKGSSYVAFERIGDPTGFTFHAEWQDQAFSMGEDVPVGSDLIFRSPLPSLFRVIHKGTVYEELEGRQFVLRAREPGAYRLEVYPVSPPSLLEDLPWIISNPIYVTN
jgi:hypothetical protein